MSKISSLTSTLTKPRVWAPTGRGDVPHEVRTDVCVYYTAQGELKKGNYKIYVYESNYLIGQSDLSLK